MHHPTPIFLAAELVSVTVIESRFAGLKFQFPNGEFIRLVIPASDANRIARELNEKIQKLVAWDGPLSANVTVLEKGSKLSAGPQDRDPVEVGTSPPENAKMVPGENLPRGTGRTHAFRVLTIANALLRPGQWVTFVDHNGVNETAQDFETWETLLSDTCELGLKLKNCETRIHSGWLQLRTTEVDLDDPDLPEFLLAIANALLRPGQWTAVIDYFADDLRIRHDAEHYRARVESIALDGIKLHFLETRVDPPFGPQLRFAYPPQEGHLYY